MTRSSYCYQDICPCDLDYLWNWSLSGEFVFPKHILLRIEWSLFVKPRVPFIQGCFLPILFKLVQWFRRRRFVNWVNVFPLLFSLEKGRGYSFEQSEFLLHKDALCQVWLKLTQWFWRGWKMWKVFRQTDESTDNRRSVKLSLELSAQVS